ncbi:hypothetical protein [Burkholderia sp. 22PA0106]|uniref:hypothetical protein n=1 Tax=Burkholderia sp. 22PA0106 TaxID=3237371 RepID=UPI0039C16A6E
MPRRQERRQRCVERQGRKIIAQACQQIGHGAAIAHAGGAGLRKEAARNAADGTASGEAHLDANDASIIRDANDFRQPPARA